MLDAIDLTALIQIYCTIAEIKGFDVHTFETQRQ